VRFVLLDPRSAALAALLALAPALPAAAQEAQAAAASPDVAATDRARSLFAEGVQLVAEQQFAEAETRFREALALRAAPAIQYNLASVLFEQGEYPEAQALNEAAIADESAPANVRDAAVQLRGQIAERAGFARFDLEGGALGGTLAIDGYAVPDAGLEVPLAPAAAHVVVVSQGETEIARREVQVEQGAHRVVAISAPMPEGGRGASPGRPIDQEEWFLPVVIGGGVAVVLIVGIAVGVAVGSGTEGPVQGNFMPGVIQW
jgi:hypothetical protein